MSKRTIIEIDQDLCDGCGACATGCPEGALRIIDGKARLVGESLCDGLGACIGACPKGAIHVLEREADEYDAFEYLRLQGAEIPRRFKGFGQKKPLVVPSDPLSVFPDHPSKESRLKNWPIQLHLVNPRAPHFANAHIVVAADCTAFALGSFHTDIVADRTLVIACPKLDSGKDLYSAKLASIIAQAASVTVVMMEVPCCSGLLRLVQEARLSSGSSMPIQTIVAGIDGGFVARKTYS